MLLVVEDNETLRLVVKLQLAKLGWQADFAKNGEEAVSTAARETYDLILMDVMMPVMDGLEATRLIRQQEQSANRPHTPVIAMTAFGDRQKCQEAGVDDFLFKPVLLETLQETMTRWLGNQAK